MKISIIAEKNWHDPGYLIIFFFAMSPPLYIAWFTKENKESFIKFASCWKILYQVSTTLLKNIYNSSIFY